MLEMSPVRKAKKEVAHKKHEKNNQFLQNSNKIMLMEIGMNDSFDQTLMQAQETQDQFNHKLFKMNPKKDQFSHLNKKKQDKSSLERQERHNRIKEYGRWLLYAGVDHLPRDKVLAHRVPGMTPVRKYEDSELESPQPRMYDNAIEEQAMEGSKGTSLSEDITSIIDKSN